MMATKRPENLQVCIRVDSRLIARADALLDIVGEEIGSVATRSHVWREALLRGVRELERLQKKKDE